MKKKKFFSTLLAATMVVTMAFAVPNEVTAAENNTIVIDDEEMTITFEGSGMLYEMYLNGELTESIEEMRENCPVSGVTRAPANPVSYVGVIQVRSSLGGYENIPAYQYTTTADHGGAEMYVVTQENGYGRDYATYAGMQVQIIDSGSIDFNNDNIVDGWLYLWDLSGISESGRFQYQSTSYNSPWNTMSTWINIR